MLRMMLLVTALLASAAQAQVYLDVDQVYEDIDSLCPRAEKPEECRRQFQQLIDQYVNAIMMGPLAVERLVREHHRLQKLYAIRS